MDKTYSKDWYISNFEKLNNGLNRDSNSDFDRIRSDAVNLFGEIGFPTTKAEDWKYTNVSPIFNYDFSSAAAPRINDIEIARRSIKGLNAKVLVFVNGHFNEKLSSSVMDLNLLGVKVGSFRYWLKKQPEIVMEHFSKYAKLKNGFVALNTASALDGAFVYVPDEVNIKDPVHILNLSGSDGSKALAQPRNLIVAGKNSKVKLIESYNSINNQPHFTNSVMEIFADEHSEVELYRIQDENSNSYNISLTQVEQRKRSLFTVYTITTGGSLVRNDINAVLDDENCETHLYGLYITGGSQHVDNHTLIDHAKPHCLSNELYKGVLDGKSHAVFNGKVFVRPDAQKTNAYQSNKNILLSKDAAIDTKPQLEIFADDVKCSHGATVGQLDDDSVFYLRSRGIGEEEARRVLIKAFANDVFEEIKLEPVHDYFNGLIQRKLK
jgi:Fe-S cluster assembly protein SufD